MAGQDYGKCINSTPEFVATPTGPECVKIFRDPTDGKFYWMDVNRNVFLLDDDGVAKYSFRAQLTSGDVLAMTVLENTISQTVNLTQLAAGKYNLEFGNELFPDPLQAGRVQVPVNGTFAGIFLQDIAGTILGAALVRYLRIDDFNINFSSFFVGSPPEEGLFSDHSVVIDVYRFTL